MRCSEPAPRSWHLRQTTPTFPPTGRCRARSAWRLIRVVRPIRASLTMRAFLSSTFLALVLMICDAHSQVIDKAAFEGTVFLQGSGSVPYVLTITYAPMSRDYTKWRHVADISLKLNRQTIAIPRDAFADLYWAGVPCPLYGDGIDSRRARFQIVGGSGEKSYTVDFVVTKDRLVLRELTRHAEKNPEVTRYDAKLK